MKTYETHLETLWKPCGKHPKACEKLSKAYANPVKTNETSVNTYGKPVNPYVKTYGMVFVGVSWVLHWFP